MSAIPSPTAALTALAEKIPGEDFIAFCRDLGILEETIRRYQFCCMSDETKYQALSQSFARDKERFVREFRPFLTETSGQNTLLRYTPNEILPVDLYRIIESESNGSWPKILRTKLQFEDDTLVSYGNSEPTLEIKIQMLRPWVERRGDDGISALQAHLSLFLNPSRDSHLIALTKEMPVEDFFHFCRRSGVPEETIRRYQFCCMSEETKYRALSQSFARDKERFVTEFRPFLTETFAQNTLLTPIRIAQSDLYHIIQSVKSNGGWPKFIRTKLQLKDHEVIFYGDFEPALEIKIQMVRLWLKRRDGIISPLQDHLPQFREPNGEMTTVEPDV